MGASAWAKTSINTAVTNRTTTGTRQYRRVLSRRVRPPTTYTDKAVAMAVGGMNSETAEIADNEATLIIMSWWINENARGTPSTSAVPMLVSTLPKIGKTNSSRYNKASGKDKALITSQPRTPV